MAQSTLQRILSEVDDLSTEEKAKLLEALQNGEEAREADSRMEAFHQALLASGMVKEIKPRRSVGRPLQLIEIPGKPVSETIVEERR
jgi:hypothetical protein